MVSGLKQYLKREWLWLKLSYPFRWAHHPTCDPYSSQRFDLLGTSLCQGCTLVTAGLLLGSLISYVMNLTSLIAFTLLVVGFGLSRRFKRLARVSIGLAIGNGLIQIIYQPWLLKLGLVLLFWTGWKIYQYFRSKSPSPDLCQTCDELPDAPRCSGIIDQFEANKKYRDLVLPVLDSDVLTQLEKKAAQALED